MRVADETGPIDAGGETASPDEVAALDPYWRAANFLGAAQIYLRDNVLLEDPLRPEHIKPRLLGDWGTVPGIDFLYIHLNRLIQAVRAATPINRAVATEAEVIVARYERKLADARSYAEAHGVDTPEIADWTWSDGGG